MNNYLKVLINSIVPFVLLGIAVSLIIGLAIMFSYVLVWGILIGVILWIVTSIKEFFFPSATTQNKVVIRGRIIEHKDDPK
ncbi:MAG: hypothetical protein A3F46_04185 [Legionellales bacterium RIFCSPHIGHO2_12_FULL_42_9]|nr:MAG: hypothetical protein A3F46_04185 [Legionellales bacterium RIFCSPHIGHO2_12_FULL_42_9]